MRETQAVATELKLWAESLTDVPLTLRQTLREAAIHMEYLQEALDRKHAGMTQDVLDALDELSRKLDNLD